MGVVIGPFTGEDWYTMKMLKEDLTFMRKDPVRFRLGLKWTKKMLREYFLTEAAA